MANADQLADAGLDLMPRSVRDKLDRAGIKLHLQEWQALHLTERRRLRDLPCANQAEIERYAAEVEQLVVRLTGRPAERMEKS